MTESTSLFGVGDHCPTPGCTGVVILNYGERSSPVPPSMFCPVCGRDQEIDWERLPQDREDLQ